MTVLSRFLFFFFALFFFLSPPQIFGVGRGRGDVRANERKGEKGRREDVYDARMYVHTLNLDFEVRVSLPAKDKVLKGDGMGWNGME